MGWRSDYEEGRYAFYRFYSWVTSDSSEPKHYRREFVCSFDGFNQST